MKKNIFLVLTFFIIFISCINKKEDKLFSKLSNRESGIYFSNDLSYDDDFNIFTYRNYFNGGGVGVIDINNDNLLDIYLTSNLNSNKLYLNLGDMKFKDITDEAGVGGTKSWSTGVSIADVNADGFLDIYVCNSGDIEGDNKQNELFINNGDQTFTEMAKEFGLDDMGFSTHAAFFDYDKDGDLDMYLLNNSYQAIGSFNLKKNERPKRDFVGGDKLFKNVDGKFIDVSEEAGIYGSVIGFGLGVTVGDIDKDGWLDIYVSNDFFERDYLYINDKNGGFNEVLEKQIRSVSAASMGADLADINNDAYSDIFVTDMLPEPDDRVKTVTTFDSWDRYQYGFNNGYWHQFTRNTLQLNNFGESFSEVGRLAGVEATDWSWGALMFDFQNDGLKDIFVANGIYRDLTNQDFLQYVTQDEVVKRITSSNKVDYKTLISYIPSEPVSNYGFINKGDLKFENLSSKLGLDQPSFSNGSAYADLDNDGDYDLIVNNVNMDLFLYKNNTNQVYPDNHFLRLILDGIDDNPYAIGAKVTIYINGEKFYKEQMPIRGFQSTVDHRLLFGLGRNQKIDSLHIVWPSDKITIAKNLDVDQTIVFSETDIEEKYFYKKEKNNSLFLEVDSLGPINYKHNENYYVDFDKDRLLFHMNSTEGPCICKGDINNDGKVDVFIGGAYGYPGILFIQQSKGKFKKIELNVFQKDKNSEDVDCKFFYANDDDFLDLYVASGGSEFSEFSTALADRLYINLGNNDFTKTDKIFPNDKFESSSVVEVSDFDNDGDFDLFVGIRLIPQNYGLSASSYILKNDGKGNFTNVTNEIAESLNNLGMVTDAKWLDIDNDEDIDLVVVGHWMPISIFENINGKYFKIENSSLKNSNGWWNVIEYDDFNGDSLPDLVVGNHGLNSRFTADDQKPLLMYVNDFDDNGDIEQVIFQYNGDESYPLSLRHDLVMQMPILKKKYLKYENYKNQTVNDIFDQEKINNSKINKVFDLETSIYISDDSLNFKKAILPVDVQFSTTNAIRIDDYNNDSFKDVLIGGNLYRVKPEMGKYDAQYGLILLGDKDGKFKKMNSIESGINFVGQVREFLSIDNYLFVLNNDEKIQTYQLKNQ